MVLSIPTNIRLRSSKFFLRFNTQYHISPLNQASQRIELPGAIWTATYTFTPYLESEDALDYIEAFLMQLRGGANTFYGYDPDRKKPKGVATGTPLVKGGSQTGTSLITDGWTASTTNIMRVGDYFTVNNELKRLTATASTNGSGEATLSFAPVLRNSPADNAPLTVNTATCIMRLVDDDQGQVESNHRKLHDGLSFMAVEVFT